MFKNKKLARVGISLVALVITFAMTITSTYAWFVISGSPSIQGYNLNLTTGGDMLEISIYQGADWQTKANFASSISTEQMQTVINELWAEVKGDGDSFLMGATTTTDGKTFVKEDGAQIIANREASQDGVGGYLSFVIRFRGYNKLNVGFGGSYITQVGDNTSGLNPIYAWSDLTKSDYIDGGDSTKINENTAIYTSAAYAARFSFIEDGGLKDTADLLKWQSDYLEWCEDNYIASGGNEQDSDEQKLANDNVLAIYEAINNMPTGETVNQAKVWIPAENAKSVKDNDTSLYDIRSSNSSFYVFSNTSEKNFANDWRDNYLGRTTTTIADYIKVDTAYGNDLLTLQKIDNSVYYYGSLAVNIWIEGWDANCTNAMLKDAFTTHLKFTGIAA